MDARVKATAIRVLTHSDQSIRMMHMSMEMELGEAYTSEDRAVLERLVRDYLKRLSHRIETLGARDQ